jgi:hypothetical protein
MKLLLNATTNQHVLKYQPQLHTRQRIACTEAVPQHKLHSCFKLLLWLVTSTCTGICTINWSPTAAVMTHL